MSIVTVARLEWPVCLRGAVGAALKTVRSMRQLFFSLQLQLPEQARD